METLKLTGNKTTISFENLKSFIFEDFREWVNGRIIKYHEL